MRYSILADAYEQLEGTTKKLAKTEIISKLLKAAPAEDLHRVVMLLTGKVFPPWDDREIGVASQLMAKAISISTGASEKEILDKFKKTGDLGSVAEHFSEKKKQRTLSEELLTVKKVFENLRKIAEQEGSGSQDKKLNLLAELLSSAKAKEAMYISRTVLEQLRVGVAEGLIRDAIAQAFDLKPEEVENAWNFRPEYGEIAEIAKEKGAKGLQKIELELGTPCNVLLAEKSPDLKTALESFEKPLLQYKYDGMRCVSGNCTIYVKNKGLTAIKNIKVGDYVLTHTGNFRKVTAKSKRVIELKERIFKLQSRLGYEFKITEGHEALTKVGNKIMWINIEDLPENAELVFPIPKLNSQDKGPNPHLRLETIDGYSKTIKLNEDFYYFLGLWVGDGYSNILNKTRRIGIVFNLKEKEKYDLCEKLVNKIFGITAISKNIHNGAMYLYWTDGAFLHWLSKNFRNKTHKGWFGKTLPEWFCNVKKSQFQAFLKGWIDSDGYTGPDNVTLIHTKESWLATYAHLIGLKFGILSCVRPIIVNGETYYRLILINSDKHAKIVRNKVFVKIYKKQELRRCHPRGIDPRQVVYNLQVEGDESYCTSFFALHNCLIHKKGEKIWIFTRRLENVTNAFPEIVEFAKKGLKAHEIIVDGETIGLNPKTGKPIPFQLLSTRIKRKYDIEKAMKDTPAQVNLFDILYLNGKTLFDKTQSERYELLKKEVHEIKDKFKIADTLITKDLKKAESYYKEALDAGHEGLIVKNLDSFYIPGRSVAGGWLKVKPVLENLDVVIVGGVWGTGKRTGWLGSLILGIRDSDTDEFKEIGMMGTGIKEKKTEKTDVTFEDVTKMLKPLIISEKENTAKIKPKIVIEVSYEEIQKSPTYESGFALRFPRFVRLRPDRSADEADDLNRVKKIYEMQKGRKK